jgi:hypothetical protein
MPASVVQVGHKDIGNPTQFAFGSAVTVGNWIVVVINAYSGLPGATAVTDNKGNTYTRDLVSSSGTGLSYAFYSAKVTTGGTGLVVSYAWTGGQAYGNMDVAEVAGLVASAPFDKSATNSGTSSAYTSGTTATLTQSDEIAFASVGVDTGTNAAITEASGWTLVGEEENGSTSGVENVAYKVVAATTALSHAWTTAQPSNPWLAVIATYKALVTFGVDNAVHAHAADNIALGVQFSVDNAAHTQTADNLSLGLFIDNAVHAQTTDSPILAVGVLSDDFNRANGALGGNWLFDSGAYTVTSNQAKRTNTGGDFAVYNAALSGPDMSVEADQYDGDNVYIAVNGRTTPALRGSTCYMLLQDPGGTQLELGKIVGGTYSTIATGAYSHTSDPVHLRLEIQGTTLRGYSDGVLRVTATDSSITTGNYAGINCANGTLGRYDNWTAAPLTVPATNLAVDNAAHAQTADSPTTTSGFAVDNATHAQVADLVVLPTTLAGMDCLHGQSTSLIYFFNGVYAVSVDSTHRKLLDQNGKVFIQKEMASWGMAQNLPNAGISEALQGCVDRHFNTVLVSLPGIQSQSDWTPHANISGQAFWTGTPWASSLGPGWASYDWLVAEATRLNLMICFTVFIGSGGDGINADISAVTVTNCYNAGLAIGQRYALVPNLMWHFENEMTLDPAGASGQRIDAIFHGLHDGEGATHRLICGEPTQGVSGYDGFIGKQLDHGYSGGYQWCILSTNLIYQYTADSVVQFDNGFTDSRAPNYPVWDCEPPYSGAGHYDGNINQNPGPVERQNLRERTWSVIVRGGCGINWGHEMFWPFGRSGLFTIAGVTWHDVPSRPETYDTQYCWDVIDLYCLDPLWRPDTAFLTAGLGTGDTKAATGRADKSLIAYFPSSRTVTVDTTVLTGTGSVRLRWYDPSLGTFATVAFTEARNAARTVTYPAAAHTDGSNDYVLIVDEPMLTISNCVHAQSADNLSFINPQTTTAQIGVLALNGVQGLSTGGPVLMQAQVGVLQLIGIPGIQGAGPATSVAQIGVLQLQGVPGSSSTAAGSTSTVAQVGVLQLQGVPGVSHGGPVTQLAQVGVIQLIGIPGYSVLPFAISSRHFTTTFKDQRVEMRVTATNGQWGLFVRGPAVVIGERPGYYAQHSPTTIDWYRAGVLAGQTALPGGLILAGPGVVELECHSDVCTVSVNGTILATHDFTANPILTDDAHQGFAAYGGSSWQVTDASGGGIPPHVAPASQTQQRRALI